ncbi:hypothetical protein pb186bvf_016619 [Paramecium bursaria]
MSDYKSFSFEQLQSEVNKCSMRLIYQYIDLKKPPTDDEQKICYEMTQYLRAQLAEKLTKDLGLDDKTRQNILE